MIKSNVKMILNEIPSTVEVLAATKTIGCDRIIEAISAGIKIIGENYVQEAERKYEVIKGGVNWHLIGHLQKNKVKRAVRIFDVIQTLDSSELAYLINRECQHLDKIMPVMIEVNIAKESQKTGILPGDLETFIDEIVKFKNISFIGLMAMGPILDNLEAIRPYFRTAKQLFCRIRDIYGEKGEWKYLSMGMSDTYRIAIEEGANIVRIGTAIFGPRR